MTPEHLRKEFKTSVQRVRDGFILAFIAMLASIPQTRHQAGFYYEHVMGKPPDPESLMQFFLAQLIIFLSALFIIVMVGNLANRRAGLKPFAWPGHKRVWPMLLLGVMLIPGAYFCCDHLLLALLPEIYPAKLDYALLYPLSVSFPDELFVRYGFLGLAAWVLGKVRGGKTLAVFFVAALFTLFDWYNVTQNIDTPFQIVEAVLFMTGVFVEHVIAGSLYLKYGFFSSLAFRLGVDLKYILYYFFFF
jgi:hypothetical protein